MVDAQAVNLAFGRKRQHEAVRRVEDFVIFHAQRSEVVDVEETTVVDLIRSDAPEGEPVGLRFEQGMQRLAVV